MANSSVTNKSVVFSSPNEKSLSFWFKCLGISLTLLNSALTLVGNSLVFVVFFKNSSLRKASNVFFMTLCIADTLFAMLVFPLEVAFLLQYPRWYLGEQLCLVWQSLYVWFGTVSIFSLSAMSVERYLTIKRPLQQDVYLTIQTACFIATSLWILSFGSAVLFYSISDQPFPNQCIQFRVTSLEFSVLILLINIVLPFIVCCISYIRILGIAKAQSLKVYQHEIPSNTTTTTSGNVKKLRESRNSKAKRTISFLLGAFAIFCLPFSIYHIVDAVLSGSSYPSQHYIEMFAKWLSYFNSALNWALYTFSNKEFKLPLLGLIPLRIRQLMNRNHSNAAPVLTVAGASKTQ